MRHIAAGLVSVLLLTGCWATAGRGISKEMASWKGHHKSEVIAKWGQPTAVADDGKGGEILTYEYDRTGSKVKPDHRAELGMMFSGTEVEQTGYLEARTLWVDSRGYIYRWKLERW